MIKKPGRPPFGTFNHMAIEVNDLDAALVFYKDILGLSELPMPESVSENKICWLDLGNGLALHIVQKDDATPGKTAHIAISVDDVKKWQMYFLSLEIETHKPQVDIYSAERIFVKDPSGNRLEFVKWLDA